MAVCVIAVAVLVSEPAHSSVIHLGRDPKGWTTNSDDAYLSWSGAVVGANIQTDTMAGLTVASDQKSAMTDLGNRFSVSASTDDYLGSYTGNRGVISGDGLLLDGGSNQATFVWTLATPSNAFGFFTYDNDNGKVTIRFYDGSSRIFSFYAHGRVDGSDSSFWGITGLTSSVASVTITTTDKGHTSTWDNFVTTRPQVVVPEPGMFAIWGTLSILGLIAARRRKGSG